MQTHATQHPPGDESPGHVPGSMPIEPDKGPSLPTVPPTPGDDPVPQPKV